VGHTVVLGGGICGLAAGSSLAERGEQVTAAAQAFAEQQGLDWDSLPVARRTALERDKQGRALVTNLLNLVFGQVRKR